MMGLLVVAVSTIIAATPYTFDDALRTCVPDGQGIHNAKQAAAFLEKPQEHILVDPQALMIMKNMRKALDQFDLMQIYQSNYLQELSGGYHGIDFQGMQKDKLLYISTHKKGDPPAVLSNMLDHRNTIALKKNDACITGGRSFIVTTDITMLTKQYSHMNIMALCEGLMKVIDPDNIRQLKTPEDSFYDKFNPESRKVLYAYKKSYPRVFELLEHYTSLHALVEIKEFNNIPYTHFSYRYGRRLDNLTKDFQELAKTLKKSEGLYTIKMKFKNAGGHVILEQIFDSHTDVFNCSFYTHKGRLIPMDAAGNPIFQEEISLTSLKDITFFGVLDLLFNVSGLQFITNDITVRNEYHNTPKAGSFSMRLDKIQRTEIKGKLYNIIPKWLLVIPDIMDDIIYDFARVLYNTNGGSGATTHIAWDTSDPNNITYHTTSINEYLDNFLVKFTLRIRNFIIKDNEKLRKDFYALIKKFLIAYQADLDAAPL